MKPFVSFSTIKRDSIGLGIIVDEIRQKEVRNDLNVYSSCRAVDNFRKHPRYILTEDDVLWYQILRKGRNGR